jgi:hypothetical protein
VIFRKFDEEGTVAAAHANFLIKGTSIACERMKKNASDDVALPPLADDRTGNCYFAAIFPVVTSSADPSSRLTR